MKSMKKLISMVLTVIMVAGCMVIPMTVSATITSLVEQDFSSLATSNDVKTSLTTLATLPWTVNASTTSTYSSVDRGDANGTALKWDIAQSAYNWSVTNTMTLPTILVNEEPAGTQVWFSFDFEIPTVDGRYDIMLYPAQSSSNGANPVWIYDLPNAASKPSFGGRSGEANAIAGTVDITGNGWHTIEVCQEKVNGENNIIDLTIYLDGVKVMTREDLVPHKWLPYSVAYLHAGFNYTASSISYDNFKNFKCHAGDHTPDTPDEPDVPIIPEVPAEYEVIGTFDDADEWIADTGSSSIDSNLSDAPGSYGKAADDTVVRLAYAAGEAIIDTSYRNQINVSKYFAVGLAPDEKRDILVSFDMKNEDANLDRQFLYKQNGSIKSFYVASYNNVYDVIPVNQWNHYDMRFTETTAELYINGYLVKSQAFSGTLTEVAPLLIQRQNLETAPAFASEFDNLVIAWSPVEESLERIQAPQKIYRHFDFSDVVSNATAYAIDNGTSPIVLAPAMEFHGVTSSVENPSVISGFAGKAADDKIMKFYANANTGTYKHVGYSSQYKNGTGVSTPKSAITQTWGRTELEPGSTVRGGVSIMLDESSLASGMVGSRRAVVLAVYPAGASAPFTQLDVQFSTDKIALKAGVKAEHEAVAGAPAINKWYRVDYVLNVADNKGGTNTVDFYLDGKLLTEEPLVVNYDSAEGLANTTPAGRIALYVIDTGAAPVYVDDFVYEYIPAGLETKLEALDKTIALPNDADESVVLANGNIILMDAATSAVTADGLNAKLCPNTPVSLVDASGAAVTSGPAAGNYAYLSRGVLPGIFYKVSDLDVAIDGKEVTATLPYAADEEVVMFVALYKDGEQLELLTCKSDTAADGKLEVTVSDDEATSYKVFLWKSEATMMPFYAAAEGSLD